MGEHFSLDPFILGNRQRFIIFTSLLVKAQAIEQENGNAIGRLPSMFS
jgi:hypothetical protein